MVTLDPRSLQIAQQDVAFAHRNFLLRHQLMEECRSLERRFLPLATTLVLDQRREQLQASAAGHAQDKRELRQRISARRLHAWAKAHPALSLN